MENPEERTGSAVPIIDFSRVPLGEIVSQAGDTVLANALRSVVEAAIAEADGDVSEFESSI
jgi:FXSXX-COOH protein